MPVFRSEDTIEVYATVQAPQDRKGTFSQEISLVANGQKLDVVLTINLYIVDENQHYDLKKLLVVPEAAQLKLTSMDDRFP